MSSFPEPSPPLEILSVAGDIYGNGFVDLIGLLLSPLGNTEHFLKNDGKGNFTVGPALPLNGSITAIGDLNHDGLNDLIINVTVFLNQGNGNFKQTAVLASSGNPGYIIDVNHDGKADFIDSGLVFLGNGDGTFGSPTRYSTGNLPAAVAADFNGDGNPDLLFSESNNVAFLLALGDAHGNFAAPRITTTTQYPAIPIAIAAGDFNGDKKPDIAVMNQGQCHDAPGGGPQPRVCPPGSVAVTAGTGQGYFLPPHYFSVGVQTGVMAVGDVNGDGKLDIVVTRAANVHQNQTSPVPYDTSVLLGHGDGTFAPAMNFHLLGFPQFYSAADAAIFLLDVNNDHKLDLVGDWGVALGNGDGTFKAPIPLPPGLGDIAAVAAGDFNRDKNVDLEIVSVDVPNGVTYLNTLLGDGKGSFTIAHTVPFTAPGFPRSAIEALIAADVNGDNIPDLIYTGYKSNNQGQFDEAGLHVQLGIGDGTFAPASTYPGAEGFNIFTGDFNRDGITDVLVSGGGAYGDWCCSRESVRAFFPLPRNTSRLALVQTPAHRLWW